MANFNFKPVFRKGPDGRVLLTDTPHAKMIKEQRRENDYSPPKPAETVRRDANNLVKKLGGDITNTEHWLGCTKIQFGCFR